jgi:hypothetical protein
MPGGLTAVSFQFLLTFLWRMTKEWMMYYRWFWIQ